MSRHTEPSLRGMTKEAKQKRKELFSKVYRRLEVGEAVRAGDPEPINGWWKPVRQKWIGMVVDARYLGAFKRRCAGFISVNDADSK